MDNMMNDRNSENTPFEKSVSGFSADDPNNLEKKRRSKLARSLLFRSFLIALCIGLFGYSVYQIGSTFISNYKSEKAYEEIRADDFDSVDFVQRAEDMDEPYELLTVLDYLNADGDIGDYVEESVKESTASTGSRYKRIYRNFLTQSEQYPDMIAWIYMTDTNINYPVMKSSNNSYYLSHNFKGEEFRAGSIMADYRTGNDFFSNKNVIIYGHNMKNGSMFRSLKVWCGSAASKKLADKSQIEIYTREGVYIYKILAYYIDDVFAYDKPFFKTEQEFLDYLTDITNKSTVKTKRTFDKDSHICTLVTCTNGTDGDSRHVVHGIFSKFYSFE